MDSKKVLPRVSLLTESLLKTLVSSAVCKVQMAHGLSDKDLGELVSCDPGTIANARNRDNKLQPQTLFNLIAVDPLALEGLLHHFGRRSVPIEARCSTDPLVTMAGAVHKIAEAQSEGSPGGKAITDSECLTLEPFIDAAMASMEALKSRALDIRRERAG